MYVFHVKWSPNMSKMRTEMAQMFSQNSLNSWESAQRFWNCFTRMSKPSRYCAGLRTRLVTADYVTWMQGEWNHGYASVGQDTLHEPCFSWVVESEVVRTPDAQHTPWGTGHNKSGSCTTMQPHTQRPHKRRGVMPQVWRKCQYPILVWILWRHINPHSMQTGIKSCCHIQNQCTRHFPVLRRLLSLLIQQYSRRLNFWKRVVKSKNRESSSDTFSNTITHSTA